MENDGIDQFTNVPRAPAETAVIACRRVIFLFAIINKN